MARDLFATLPVTDKRQPVDLFADLPPVKEKEESFDPQKYAISEANRLGVKPSLVLGVIKAESSFKDGQISPKGAKGYMQLMDSTAKELGVTDPTDPKQNITAGITYLKKQLDEFKSPELALAAYNAGPGTVRNNGNQVPNYPETQNYIKKVLGKQTTSDFLREDLKKASWLDRNIAGAGAAMIEGYEGLKGVFGQSNPEDVALAKVAQQEAPVGGIVGNVAMMAPTMLIPGATTVPGAAAIGGAYNALTTPGSIGDRKQAAVMGVLGGGAAQGISNALAKGFPAAMTVGKDLLSREGVTLTPGQYAGGAWKAMEDKATSIPVLGDVINSARKRGVEEFNQAALKRATLPGMKVEGVGNGAIQDVRQGLGDAYDTVLAQASVPGLDPQFMTNMVNLGGMVKSGLPDREFKAFQDVVQREVIERMAPNGQINAENIQAALSGLKNQASLFSKSTDAYQRKLGDALNQTAKEFYGVIERSNPDLAGALGKIDKAYAHFKTIQKAGSGVGAVGGVFTPAQLHRAVKAADRTKDKRAFSEGTALFQDLTTAGKEIMPSKVPDSGTAGRLFGNMFSLNGALSTVGGTAAAIPALALYSKTGSKATNALYKKLADSKNPNALRILTGAASKQNSNLFLGAPVLQGKQLKQRTGMQ